MRETWLWRLIFYNLGWKLLSLVAAAAIWALVASEPELSTFVNVPVEYKNLPADLEISSKPVTTVLLELQGPAGELSGGASGPSAQVVLDMSRAAPGEKTFTIDEGTVKVARGVRLLRANPEQMQFLFEKSASRTVPVEVRTMNEGQQGYYIVSKEPHPATLEISGPASHVAAITAARTDTIDVAGVVSSKEFQSTAYIPDPLVKISGSPQVEVVITMKKK